MAAYGDICSALKNPQRGLNALYFFKSKNKYKNKNLAVEIKNVNVYNSLLKGFARKGDYNKMREVLQLMKEAEVPFNIQSHIYVLECLGRINVKDNHLKDIRLSVNEIFGDQITFDEIMNAGVFYDGQREIVLKAITAHSPSYIPKYSEPEMQYSNHLVNHLNNNKQLEDTYGPEKSGLFSAENLEEAVRKQMDLEKAGYVTVSSFYICI